MVNKTRQSLLETFQSASSWISGEDLSRKFGISRVAIWKHIKALQDEGYLIEAGHKGYRLTGETDNLSSMDFASSGEILFFRDLESTMKEAGKRRTLLEEEDFIVLAEHQSGGIARGEKAWDSPDGGIYMTCMINRALPLEEAGVLPLKGILTVLKTLVECGIPSPGYRLPGDILIEDRKIGGLLEEYHVRGGRICWFALGIGIHVNDTLKNRETSGLASIQEMTGIQLLRKEFIYRFTENWKRYLEQESFGIKKELEYFRNITG